MPIKWPGEVPAAERGWIMSLETLEDAKEMVIDTTRGIVAHNVFVKEWDAEEFEYVAREWMSLAAHLDLVERLARATPVVP